MANGRRRQDKAGKYRHRAEYTVLPVRKNHGGKLHIIVVAVGIL